MKSIVQDEMAGAETFGVVADAAPVMMWLGDADGNCTFCNKHWLTFRGRTLEEELGRGWIEGIHPDDVAWVLESVAAATKAHRQIELEFRIRRADGEYRWVLDVALPRFDTHGRYAGYIGSCVDITRRRRIENTLHSIEGRFRRLADNAQDTVYRFRVRPTRGVEYVNRAVLPLTGHTPEEFYADPDLILRCVHPDDRHLLAAAVPDPDTANFNDTVVLRFLHSDGRTTWGEFRRGRVLDEEGRVVAVEGIGRDITSRVEGEDSFRRLAAALQTAREQERAAVARELHDELGQTLTSLKMEVVRISTELVGVGGVGLDRLQSIIGSIELATETVRRLATSLRPPALDHLGLVAAIELEAAAMARRSQLRCRVVAKRPVTLLSPEQSTALFRIVQEALTNVLRHAGASAVTITLTQRAKELSIRIHDNGRGITRAEVDNPSSIGLLGMRERAAAAGAAVNISAKPRRGTTVLVTVATP